VDQIPRIRSVRPLSDSELLVCFDNGVEKLYDCAPLFTRHQFSRLRVPALFRAVRADPGGYGISWNDDLDLSEYELWTNGKLVESEVCRGDLSVPAQA
jgi:hypothetical protein